MKNLNGFNLSLGATPTIDRTITYIGASSSGRMHQYAVTPKYRSELEAAGVVFSEHRENSFYAATRIYLAPTVGSTFTHEVASFISEGRKVNYFKGIDKAKQKAFVNDQMEEEDARLMAKAKAKGLSEDALFKAQIYKLRIQKLRKEIGMLSSSNAEDALGA